MANYKTADLLPYLGNAVSGLRSSIRDCLFTCKISNFRVLCPDEMLVIAPQRDDLPLEDVGVLAALWGKNPVHPSSEPYGKIAGG